MGPQMYMHLKLIIHNIHIPMTSGEENKLDNS